MLIGIHGKKQAGKDTACHVIQEVSDLPVEHRSFAGLLKLSAYRIFNPSATMEEALEWADNIKLGKHQVAINNGNFVPAIQVSGREFLQRYGCEAHRDVFGPDFWVDQALPVHLDHDHRVVVLTDVRFENEAQRILDLGGEVWKIIRPALDADDDHPSEQPLPGRLITKYINNIGTLEEFQRKINSEFAMSYVAGEMVADHSG